MDHRHSPADVAAGAILGALIAPPWLARAITHDFCRHRHKPHGQHPADENDVDSLDSLELPTDASADQPKLEGSQRLVDRDADWEDEL